VDELRDGHFRPLLVVCAGQYLTREHALILDAYRRAHGLTPWLSRPPGSNAIPSAAEVNQAVTWWNAWLRPDLYPTPEEAL
jgi:hypothetical protein